MLYCPTAVGADAGGCHTTHIFDGADILHVPLSAWPLIPVSYTKTMLAFTAPSLRPYVILDTSFWQLCTFDNKYKYKLYTIVYIYSKITLKGVGIKTRLLPAHNFYHRHCLGNI